MADILGLATTEKVRAQWGATLSELPDLLMDSLDLGIQLKIHLADNNIPYSTILSEGAAEGASEAQVMLLDRLKLYSSVYCAHLCRDAVLNAVPQERGDGNNVYTRFDKLEKAAEGIDARLQALFDGLNNAILPGNTLIRSSLCTAAVRDFDPVSGSGGATG